MTELEKLRIENNVYKKHLKGLEMENNQLASEFYDLQCEFAELKTNYYKQVILANAFYKVIKDYNINPEPYIYGWIRIWRI